MSKETAKSITLTPELVGRISSLVSNTSTWDDTLVQVIKLGCYQLEYRREKYQHDKKEREEFKSWKALQKK